MELIDRRGFARGILFGSRVAAAGLAVSPGAASAMPLDDRVPGALDDWIEKAQAVVVTSAPVAAIAAIGAASGVAGGVEAAASAAGAGCSLRRKFYSLASNL